MSSWTNTFSESHEQWASLSDQLWRCFKKLPVLCLLFECLSDVRVGDMRAWYSCEILHFSFIIVSDYREARSHFKGKRLQIRRYQLHIYTPSCAPRWFKYYPSTFGVVSTAQSGSRRWVNFRAVAQAWTEGDRGTDGEQGSVQMCWLVQQRPPGEQNR